MQNLGFVGWLFGASERQVKSHMTLKFLKEGGPCTDPTAAVNARLSSPPTVRTAEQGKTSLIGYGIETGSSGFNLTKHACADVHHLQGGRPDFRRSHGCLCCRHPNKSRGEGQGKDSQRDHPGWATVRMASSRVQFVADDSN